MENLRRLIDIDKIKPIEFPSTEMDGLDVVRYLNTLPTVDAVPVDEIRVDFMSICLENQEAILNVSICGKPNEVKLPFSKDVAEVVHGRWAGYHEADIGYDEYGVRCSNCNFEVEDNEVDFIMNYCPNCGAKMDGDGNV